MILFVIGLLVSIFEKGNEKVQKNQIDSRNQLFNMANDQEKDIKLEGLFQLIGKTTNDVKDELGDPDRIDPSLYEYNWWIYNDHHKKYVQVGIEKDRVVTLYVMGEKLNIKPFYIGQPILDIRNSYFIPSILEIEHQGQEFQFELSEEDINIRPIIQIGHIYVQLYMDKYTGTLSSIRMMDVPTLLDLKPFDYREEYMEPSVERVEINDSIEKALQTQIFDLSNILRERYHVKTLKWNDELVSEAYVRFSELYDDDSQISTDKDLALEQEKGKDQTNERQHLLYFSEGENVAVHALDAPAIVEGWFNSKVHRENMLNQEFKETGIVLYKDYLIQKFSPVNEEKSHSSF
ncbi:CAP-associated domain-containing protein [Niallia sp. Krafla_26]|uniref:CAP-associated domain-containing protein n=1 Tax=Niallia sp. Krafla_26 TaxID=3064703 RepID=UPI003D180288